MIDDYSQKFTNALIKHDLEALKSIPKADLHNHAALGGMPSDFNLPIVDSFDGYTGMKQYIAKYITPYSRTVSGYKKYVEATCKQAVSDGVIYLETSIDFRFREMFENIEKANEYLRNLKERFSNKCIINFDLGISRGTFNQFEKAKELLSENVFTGIDLYGDEFSRPIKYFKELFIFAKNKNKICKAHLGEYGSAADIYAAINILCLDEVQHGINIIENKEFLRKARDLNIVFNICVSSNIKLKITKNYVTHPIRKMFDNGLLLTLNSDDTLLFNVNLSEEFFNLYSLNIFNETELDKIRQVGLRRFV